MKKLSAIMMVLVLISSVLTACGPNNNSDSNSNSAPPSSIKTPVPTIQVIGPDLDDTDEENKDGVTFHDATWFIKARIEDKIDVGALYNLAGMYNTYVYNIKLSHVGISPAGQYYLDMDYSVELNSDEVADSLLSAELGAEISGMGLGVNGIAKGRLELDDDPLTVSKIAPQHMIKDKNGNQVSMAGNNYFLEETLTIPYESTGGTAILGYDFGGPSEDVIRIFIVFGWEYDTAYDAPGSDYVVPIDVYITYPEFAKSQGREIWHHAEGTITRRATDYTVTD